MGSPPIDVRDRKPYSVNHFKLKRDYGNEIESILISKGEIESRIERMASDITDEFSDSQDNVVNIFCTLKGAIRFFVDLNSRIEIDSRSREGILKVTRYDQGKPRQQDAKIQFIDETMIRDTDVLVIEDMIDEGHTLNTIIDRIQSFNPNSIDIAVLFDKAAKRKVEVNPTYTGFVIPDEFVVGYGIDFNERYRNLQHLATLRSDVMNGEG